MSKNEKRELLMAINRLINAAAHEVPRILRSYPLNIIKLNMYLDAYRHGMEMKLVIQNSERRELS